MSSLFDHCYFIEQLRFPSFYYSICLCCYFVYFIRGIRLSIQSIGALDETNVTRATAINAEAFDIISSAISIPKELAKSNPSDDELRQHSTDWEQVARCTQQSLNNRIIKFRVDQITGNTADVQSEDEHENVFRDRSKVIEIDSDEEEDGEMDKEE